MADFPKPRVISGHTNGVSFTRPADTTTYAAGDLVANSTTAGSVTPILFTGVARQTGYRSLIKRIRAMKSKNLVDATAVFRLHLFSAIPTVTNGDNGALVLATNQASWLGAASVSFVAASNPTLIGPAGAFVNQSWTDLGAARISFVSSQSANLWGLLEAMGAYIPASAETFGLELDVDQF